MNKAWVYCIYLGKWKCQNTFEVGFPKAGEYYLDLDEWRLW